MDIMKMGKNPNYLGSWDLEELPGREAALTIARIADEKVEGVSGKSEVCTVCYWAEDGYKPMILNVTNKKALCRLYKTKDTDKLRGKAVLIGIDRVRAFGGDHDALRIRPRVPAVRSDKPAPKCAQCGRDVTPSGSMTAEQVAAYALKKCGRVLCVACGKSQTEVPHETDA